MNEPKAVDQLRRDLAVSVASNRPDAEAIVITNQDTVREVLLELERRRDRIENPQYHIERFTLPAVKLTDEQKSQSSPVPVIPWKDYGNPRQG